MFKSTKFSNQDVNHVIHFYHKKRKKLHLLESWIVQGLSFGNLSHV